MAEGKIIAVWGSPNSGKTTFATKLAASIYSSFESTVITLFCDLETPVLPGLPPAVVSPAEHLGLLDRAGVHVACPDLGDLLAEEGAGRIDGDRHVAGLPGRC